MYKLKKKTDIDKNAKIQHDGIVFIEILMALASLGLMIYHFATGDPNHRAASTFSSIIWFLLPMIAELLLKKRFAPVIHLVYTIHITLAIFMGCGLNFHATVEPYDEIMHFFFGYAMCLYIFYFLLNWRDMKRQSPAFVIVLIFLMSMGTATLWEIAEFGTDVFFNQTSLGIPPEAIVEEGIALGYSGVRLNIYVLMNGIGVWDTITDMCLHLAGTVLFAIQYVIEINVKRPLMLGYIERDFVKTRNIFYDRMPDVIDANGSTFTDIEVNIEPIKDEDKHDN